MRSVDDKRLQVLAGRVAIVTGAAANLGAGIVEALVTAGAAVVLGARRLDLAEELASRLRQQGGRVIAVRNDVTESGSARQLVDHALEEWGRLDIVMHNASSVHSSKTVRLEDVDDGAFEEQWAVSLGAAWELAVAAFAPLKASSRGRFFVMSSTQGLHGGSMNPTYSALKSGLRGFAKSLAREWGPHGIIVAAIAPAALTDAARQYLERNPAFAAAIAANTPLGRLGDPRDDIGRTLVAMCSDDWNYATGLTLMVDGGQYLGQ